MKEAIRRLQKDGTYHFEGLTREESKKAAIELAKGAMRDDRKNGIDSKFGIGRDAFGYYFAAAITNKEDTEMDFTTIEKLQLKVSASYGAVLKYGDKVFVTDIFWKGGFTAEIYEFVETPEETGLGDIECRLHLIDKADEPFEDNGHAIAWCLSRK